MHYHDLFTKISDWGGVATKLATGIFAGGAIVHLIVFPVWSSTAILALSLYAAAILCLFFYGILFSIAVIGLFTYDGWRAWKSFTGHALTIDCVHCACTYSEMEEYHRSKRL